eukprot:Nitzschia sp. Nitz4//scaffold200_size39268//13919//14479//NITZ4_007615-RA/size39268-processed-gene-0.14-mRNA-1//-1//CDS//3329541283//2664//frame0
MNASNGLEKKVRFCRRVSMRKVPLARTFTSEEKRRIWFQPSELEMIREHLKKTILFIFHNVLVEDTEDYCMRGAEIGLPSCMARRRFLKRKASEVVVREVRRQHDMGFCDPERIREVYLPFSKQSETDGLNRGLTDAIAVQILQLEESAAKLSQEHHTSTNQISPMNTKDLLHSHQVLVPAVPTKG